MGRTPGSAQARTGWPWPSDPGRPLRKVVRLLQARCRAIVRRVPAPGQSGTQVAHPAEQIPAALAWGIVPACGASGVADQRTAAVVRSIAPSRAAASRAADEAVTPLSAAAEVEDPRWGRPTRLS